MLFSLIIAHIPAHIGRKARNGHGQNGTGKRIGTHGKRPKSALRARAALDRQSRARTKGTPQTADFRTSAASHARQAGSAPILRPT